jgi:CheY-like chemotaxis protein
VDDSEDDFIILRRAFAKANVEASLAHMTSAQKAQVYLWELPKTQLPRLIVLDVKMPGMSGHDFLSWIKDVVRLKHIPVVMLSSSALESDTRQAMDLGALDFLTKPTELDGYQEIVARILKNWTMEETAE